MMFLVYLDGKYHAWTRSPRMHVRAAAGVHTLGVVARDDQGRRSPPATITARVA